MNYIPYRNFGAIANKIQNLLASAPVVEVGEWQAIRNPDMPQMATIEAEDVSFTYNLPRTVDELAAEVRPNRDWADEHFAERVSGIPYNPPPSHVRWPYAQKSNAEHVDETTKFSHTYPERFWPKGVKSGRWESVEAANFGLRFAYGDLGDLVNLLRDRPGTRQAYLPVWYPEDTGAVSEQRVPCTLGYHFLVRNGELKVVYYIRSCDFFRHFRDDVYLAARLGMWVADQIGVRATRLVMHVSSMHVFAAERQLL